MDYSGKTGETYAEVVITRDESIDYFYVGKIVKYGFPANLASLIDEYDGLVNASALSLLDDVKEKIYWYELKLKVLDTKIFSPSIKEKSTITFFTKYPTSKGYLDNYPI